MTVRVGAPAVLAAALMSLASCSPGRALFPAEEEAGPIRLAEPARARHAPAAADRSSRVREIPAEPGPGPVEQMLAARLDELAAIGPQRDAPETGRMMGPDLHGEAQRIIAIDMRHAVDSAVTRNLALGAARLEPEIGAEDRLAAEAAFDVVLFGNAEFAQNDQSLPPGVFFAGSQAFERYRLDTGVRMLMRSGGTISVQGELERFRLRQTSFQLPFDPTWTAAVRASIVQPLLRGIGSAVTTANIRLAAAREESARAQVRVELERVLLEVQDAYWNLAQAWNDLTVAEWLYEVGTQVRDVLERRRSFDARPAEYADAVARVEQRRADIIRAQRAVRSASDRLKVLMNDPDLPIGSEALLRTSDGVAAAALRADFDGLITTALERRGEIERARLAVVDASIRLGLADNARLPDLSLRAEAAYFGTRGGAGSAARAAADLDAAQYLVALALEYPLGNRAAEAGERSARLQRTQAWVRYRQSVQDVIVEVKDALRGVFAGHELIEATRSFRVAQAENLRALLVREEKITGLTPEFLNLKFQQQDLMASATRQEFAALADFRRALAQLDRAVGTGLEANGFTFESLPPSVMDVESAIGKDRPRSDGPSS